MTINERRFAGASAALSLTVALFTSGAFGQHQAPTLESAVSAPVPAVTGSITKNSMPEVPVCKRITVGTYKGVNAIREALDAARMRVGDSADEILGRPTLPYSKMKIELDLVVVTAADLGFPTGSTPVADIYRRAVQFGLDLCPPEVGPQLRLQYANQSLGEFLHIAMHPVATYYGDPTNLTVGNGGAGLLLIGGDGNPELKLHSTVKFVFVRPAQVAKAEDR
jgi:hypothetical protein